MPSLSYNVSNIVRSANVNVAALTMQGSSAHRPVPLEVGWAKMQTGITKLIRILEEEPGVEHFSANEYMQSYTVIYDMCTQKPPNDHSEVLYRRYRQAFENYIREKVIDAFAGLFGEYLLRELHKRWSNHKIMVRWLSNFFNYLDRYYVARHSLDTLQKVGNHTFRDNIYNSLKLLVKQAVLDLIWKEREGEVIDRILVKNILDIFITMGMDTMECYEQDFEQDMLEATSQYYKVKAAAWIMDDSCPEYMIKAEECLRQEEDRIQSYLDVSSKKKLLKRVETELLTENKDALLYKANSGCQALLTDDKMDDLARMYRLFIRIPGGLDPIADIFKSHVDAEGLKCVKDATASIEERRAADAVRPGRDSAVAHEQQFVRHIIALHDKYMEYVVTCFSNNPLFHRAMTEACEGFCQKNVAGTSTAELFANFCDNLLKKGGSERISDEAIESTLEKVVKLLAYISDKDLFAEFYRKKLARRLLFEKSNSDEHEQTILSRLKQQCGAQFTSKMEGMLTDLQVAREKQLEFEGWCRCHGKELQVDMSVQVLTTGFWPTYKGIDLELPEEMEQGVRIFKEFYEDTTKHRRLNWMYVLGSCTVKAHYAKKSYDFILTTLQAAILLTFNQSESEELTFEEIKHTLKLHEDDVYRTLHSLSCGRYKILLKSPEEKVIKKTDTFKVNTDFQEKMMRIRVPVPLADDRRRNVRRVYEDVDKDRRFAVDAAIVRTMKSRRVLKHQQLILEVNQQLQRMFKPEIRLIKKSIDDLIGREYLERDKDDPNTFKYLA